MRRLGGRKGLAGGVAVAFERLLLAWADNLLCDLLDRSGSLCCRYNGMMIFSLCSIPHVKVCSDNISLPPRPATAAFLPMSPDQVHDSRHDAPAELN